MARGRVMDKDLADLGAQLLLVDKNGDIIKRKTCGPQVGVSME
jgi:hypothetical protein